MSQVSPTATSETGPSHTTTPTSHQHPHVVEEPNYQTIPSPAPVVSTSNPSPPLIEPSYQSVPAPTSPGHASSSTHPPGPTIIYQVNISLFGPH